MTKYSTLHTTVKYISRRIFELKDKFSYDFFVNLYYNWANLCLSVCLCAIQSNSFYPIITEFGTRVDGPKRMLIEKNGVKSVHYCVHAVDF